LVALQGYHKNDPTLLEVFGEEKIIEWRRSYHTAPPSLYDQHFLKHIGTDCLVNSSMDQRYFDPTKVDRALRGEPEVDDHFWPYPTTESLKDCEHRAFGFWKEVIAPRVKAGERVLICAHANTIRALVKSIDNISDDLIPHLKIPNGVPLVYTLDKNLEPKLDLTDDLGFQAKYLVSARNHKKVIKCNVCDITCILVWWYGSSVACLASCLPNRSHSSLIRLGFLSFIHSFIHIMPLHASQMMSYERCVRKKLRSLFEYLDTDKDGRITPACLTSGLSRLLNYESGGADGAVKLTANGVAVSPNGVMLNANGAQYGSNTVSADFCGVEDVCEFEIEELLRCVPR
jgi:bisphosphoglycerate-dependent phosphoglycerate mutase family 1